MHRLSCNDHRLQVLGQPGGGVRHHRDVHVPDLLHSLVDSHAACLGLAHAARLVADRADRRRRCGVVVRECSEDRGLGLGPGGDLGVLVLPHAHVPVGSRPRGKRHGQAARGRDVRVAAPGRPSGLGHRSHPARVAGRPRSLAPGPHREGGGLFDTVRMARAAHAGRAGKLAGLFAANHRVAVGVLRGRPLHLRRAPRGLHSPVVGCVQRGPVLWLRGAVGRRDPRGSQGAGAPCPRALRRASGLALPHDFGRGERGVPHGFEGGRGVGGGAGRGRARRRCFGDHRSAGFHVRCFQGALCLLPGREAWLVESCACCRLSLLGDERSLVNPLPGARGRGDRGDLRGPFRLMSFQGGGGGRPPPGAEP
mmetsp:Transcript_56384/g.171743  ORF Transcript_56384/g.171743 Transcript_56384/m.171743 type:complete len:366 (+) Transcript_56384:1160-2257(+)